MEEALHGPGHILVEAASGRVVRDGAPVALSDRETALCVALAAQRRAISRRSLANLLYPDRDAAAAANMLKVYIHRLRHRVAPDFIVRGDSGYALGPRCSVDVDRAACALLRLARDGGPQTAAEAEPLLALAAGLRAEAPAHLEDNAWYGPIAQRAHHVGRDLSMAIARTMLERGDAREAIRIARGLTYEDACDEEAWELQIRAHFDAGEPVAAVQGFRFYEAAARELDVRPSPFLRRLFDEPRHAATI